MKSLSYNKSMARINVMVSLQSELRYLHSMFHFRRHFHMDSAT